MFAMSNRSRPPRSERFRCSFARASRSRRSRSMSARCSQSTCIVPYVRRAIGVSSLTPDELARGLRDEIGCGNGFVLKRRRERDRHVERSKPAHRRVETPERILGYDGRELGARAVAAVALVHDDGAARLLRAADERVAVERDERAWVDDLCGDSVRLELLS